MTEQTNRYQNYLLVTLVIMFTAVTVAAHQFKVPTIMGDVAAAVNMAETTAPWLMSIFTFVGIFLAIPAGSMAQRFTPKIMVVAAALFVVLGSLIGSFATSASLLIISRGIEGIGFIFATVCGPLAIARYVEPSKLGFAMGIWAIWVPVGQILAFNLTPILFNTITWNSIWMVYAVLSLIMAGVVQFSVDGKIGTISESTGQEVKFSDVFSKRNLWLLCITFCLFNFAFMATISFAPAFLEGSGMMSKSAAAFVTTIPMILCIFSSPIYGKVSDIIRSRKKPLLVALLVLGPSLSLMFTNSAYLVYLGAVLFGAIGMGVPAMVLSSVGEVVENPELAGLGMGLMMIFQNLGMFLGTLIFPMVLVAMGGNYTTTGLIMIPIVLLALIIAFLTKFK